MVRSFRGPMSKDEIRRLVRVKRRELNPVWIEQKSLVIEREVVDLPEFKKADIVCCYLAMEHEVRTDRIMEECWKQGKTVCVPAYSKKAGRYRLSRLEKDIPIIEGHWKVWEPARIEWIATERVDVVVVPGIAFDRSCGRLGHGAGHYDRLLCAGRTRMKCFKVGAAFDFQLFDSVPMTESDVRMSIVVTEKRVVKSDGIAS